MSSVSKIPFSEPSFVNFPSPYYNESHFKFRLKVRNFVEKELMPYVEQWEKEGTFPRDLHRICYKYGLYALEYPVKYGGQTFAGYDYFHRLIFADEMARCACGGLLACLGTLNVSLGPILQCTNEAMKNRILPDILRGEKLIALAISEPGAGSDISRIECSAVEDPNDSNFYIVNGEKFLITNGMRADYFSTAVKCKTRKTEFEITFLLIERTFDGIICVKQETQGWWTSNTAHITFKNVRVPKSNIIGEENKAWSMVMNNFSAERFLLPVVSNRMSRICIEESVKYARVRKTFGKRLIDHQIIRHKIMNMVKKVEATHAMIERVAYMANLQNNQRISRNQRRILASLTALTKVQASQTVEFCAREAMQIFGGRGYLRGGVASKVERIYREVRVMAIGGGSEEVLINLAARSCKL